MDYQEINNTGLHCSIVRYCVPLGVVQVYCGLLPLKMKQIQSTNNTQ